MLSPLPGPLHAPEPGGGARSEPAGGGLQAGGAAVWPGAGALRAADCHDAVDGGGSRQCTKRTRTRQCPRKMASQPDVCALSAGGARGPARGVAARAGADCGRQSGGVLPPEQSRSAANNTNDGLPSYSQVAAAALSQQQADQSIMEEDEEEDDYYSACDHPPTQEDDDNNKEESAASKAIIAQPPFSGCGTREGGDGTILRCGISHGATTQQRSTHVVVARRRG